MSLTEDITEAVSFELNVRLPEADILVVLAKIVADPSRVEGLLTADFEALVDILLILLVK